MWFNKKDLTIKPIIKIDDLHGYVLPHAGTTHTGQILSHTLRFRPTKNIKKIIILYYPAEDSPDINIENIYYFHEYYVPWKSIEYVFNDNTILYEGYNIKDFYINTNNTNTNKLQELKKLFNIKDTLIVVSADFSHFLSFDNAINLENKAAHSLMFRELNNSPYIHIVDDVKTFRLFYKIIPFELQLQWIGRTRSSGEKGVGYLSFLLREKTTTQLPDGIFVTAFDKNMNSRECLGQWFNTHYWTQDLEKELVNKVLYLAQTTSRLSGGSYLDIPISNYTVTYLYKDIKNNFIRGWHGILHNAFYLSDVFLENTYNNGKWIKHNDNQWQLGNKFNLSETLQKLNMKAGINNNIFIKKNKKKTKNTKKTKKTKNTKKNMHKYTTIVNSLIQSYTLYSSKVIHYKI